VRRREFLTAVGTVTGSLALFQIPQPVARKGHLKQGVTQGVFGRGMSVEDCCREACFNFNSSFW